MSSTSFATGIAFGYVETALFMEMSSITPLPWLAVMATDWTLFHDESHTSGNWMGTGITLASLMAGEPTQNAFSSNVWVNSLFTCIAIAGGNAVMELKSMQYAKTTTSDFLNTHITEPVLDLYDHYFVSGETETLLA